jgi:hypothetical protein
MMVEASIVNLAELGVLVVGVVIGLQQLNDIKQTRELELETRQAQLFTVIMNKMDTPEWWSHYRTIRDLPGKTFEEIAEIMNDPIKYGGFYSILTFFNKLGWLVKREVLDFEVFSEVINTTFTTVYENTKPILDESEKRTGKPQDLPHFEYLYNRIKTELTNLT